MELVPWNFKPWSLIRVDHLREETVCLLHKLHLLFWLFIQRSFVGASEATLWKENSELVFSCWGNRMRSLIDTYHWKYRTSNLYSMFGFWQKCTDRSKLNFKIKMMRPYHIVQMSTQRRIWLQCMCWQQALSNTYIKVEFDVGYFQW